MSPPPLSEFLAMTAGYSGGRQTDRLLVGIPVGRVVVQAGVCPGRVRSNVTTVSSPAATEKFWMSGIYRLPVSVMDRRDPAIISSTQSPVSCDETRAPVALADRRELSERDAGVYREAAIGLDIADRADRLNAFEQKTGVDPRE